MKKIQTKDWHLWGEWFKVYWFHSCYLEGMAYTIPEKTGNGLSQIVAELDDGVQRFYFSRREWTEIGGKYLDEILEDPQKLEDVLHEIRQASDALVSFSDALRKTQFTKLPLEQQLDLLRQYHEKHHALWSLGMVPNVLELENSFLTDYLKTWLQSKGLSADAQIRAFQLLATPRELSAAQRQEHDLLRLVQQSATAEQIVAHRVKYQWLQFGWTGPDLDQSYFQTVYEGLRKDGKTQAKVQELISEQNALEQRKHDLMNSLQIPDETVRLFRALEELLFMKTYRMDALFESFSAVQPFLKAMAKSQHLSLNQVYYLYQEWFIEMIRTQTVDEHRINDIGKYSIRYFDGEDLHLLVGQEAHLFMEPIKAQLPKVEKVNELKGECAYPGKVSGVVKVINLVSEMSKFQAGDILISNVTDPTLLPIMKKAAAFVTNQGGLTCHAAIVARELQTPCLIGTKIATHVFADGDRVEVDATKGVVKKLH